MSKKMGFEGIILSGPAGATATSQLANARDINYDFTTTKGSTTARGDSSAPPIGTARVTGRGVSIGWTMLNRTTDTALAALLAASFAGTPMAIRLKDHASGKGYDGDCILEHRIGKPLEGEQTIEFTAEPNDDLRDPQLYV
jgi:hypothetical protein